MTDLQVLTRFQQRLLDALEKTPNTTATVRNLAWALRSNNVAVASSANALERLGIVVMFPGAGISAPIYVALKDRASGGHLPVCNKWPCVRSPIVNGRCHNGHGASEGDRQA